MQFAHQSLNAKPDRSERIVNFMGDASRQQAKLGQALLMRYLGYLPEVTHGFDNVALTTLSVVELDQHGMNLRVEHGAIRPNKVMTGLDAVAHLLQLDQRADYQRRYAGLVASIALVARTLQEAAGRLANLLAEGMVGQHGLFVRNADHAHPVGQSVQQGLQELLLRLGQRDLRRQSLGHGVETDGRTPDLVVLGRWRTYRQVSCRQSAGRRIQRGQRRYDMATQQQPQGQQGKGNHCRAGQHEQDGAAHRTFTDGRCIVVNYQHAVDPICRHRAMAFSTRRPVGHRVDGAQHLAAASLRFEAGGRFSGSGLLRDIRHAQPHFFGVGSEAHLASRREDKHVAYAIQAAKLGHDVTQTIDVALDHGVFPGDLQHAIELHRNLGPLMEQLITVQPKEQHAKGQRGTRRDQQNTPQQAMAQVTNFAWHPGEFS